MTRTIKVYFKVFDLDMRKIFYGQLDHNKLYIVSEMIEKADAIVNDHSVEKEDDCYIEYGISYAFVAEGNKLVIEEI